MWGHGYVVTSLVESPFEREMNSTVGEAVDKKLRFLPSGNGQYCLDRTTFTAIEARMLEHFDVTAGPFLPEGTPARERNGWVSSIKHTFHGL